MSRKGSYSLSEKLRAITDFVSGEKAVTQICTEMTINIAEFYERLRKYNDIDIYRYYHRII